MGQDETLQPKGAPTLGHTRKLWCFGYEGYRKSIICRCAKGICISVKHEGGVYV